MKQVYKVGDRVRIIGKSSGESLEDHRKYHTKRKTGIISRIDRDQYPLRYTIKGCWFLYKDLAPFSPLKPSKDCGICGKKLSSNLDGKFHDEKISHARIAVEPSKKKILGMCYQCGTDITQDMLIPSKKEEREHEFEVSPLGLSSCKRCGVHQTIPIWPPFCTPKPKKEECKCRCHKQHAILRVEHSTLESCCKCPDGTPILVSSPLPPTKGKIELLDEDILGPHAGYQTIKTINQVIKALSALQEER